MLHQLLEAVSLGGVGNFDIVVNSGDHPLIDSAGSEDGACSPPVFSIATTKVTSPSSTPRAARTGVIPSMAAATVDGQQGMSYVQCPLTVWSLGASPPAGAR